MNVFVYLCRMSDIGFPLLTRHVSLVEEIETEFESYTWCLGGRGSATPSAWMLSMLEK